MVDLDPEEKLLQGHSTPTGLSDVCHLQLSGVHKYCDPPIAAQSDLPIADLLLTHQPMKENQED